MASDLSHDADDSAKPSATRGELYSLLGNRRRRQTLEVMRTAETPIDVSDLIDRVAAVENEKPIAEVTAAERKRVHTALKQTHLPKIESSGLVEHDASLGVLETTESLEELDIYLKVAGKRALPSSVLYLTLTVLSGLLMAGVLIGVEALTVLPDAVWAGLVVGMFGLTALVHLYYTKRMRVDPAVARK